MTKPEIRLLSEADVEIFWTLRLRALKEEPESFGAAHEESSNRSISEVAARLQDSDNSFVFGAFDPDLVGTVGFGRRQGVKMRHKGTIWGMYVAPEARGKGVARALMLAAISRARSLAGMEQLLLAVVTTNEAARNLYVSLGFKSYGLECAALKLANSYLDEHLFVLNLDDATPEVIQA